MARRQDDDEDEEDIDRPRRKKKKPEKIFRKMPQSSSGEPFAPCLILG